MEANQNSRLDPEQVSTSYVSLRSYLIAESEKQYAAEDSCRHKSSWREHRPKTADKYLLKKLGIDHARLNDWAAEELAAYREYYASEVEPQLTERHPITSVPAPVESEMLDPQTRLPILYAILSVASDKDLLSEAPPGADIHNPWYEQQTNPSKCSDLFIERWGEGHGMYDATLLPEYHHYARQDLYWIYFYVPKSDQSVIPWSCSNRVWLHGAIHCWADDSWYNYLYAGIEVSHSFFLVPSFIWPTNPSPAGTYTERMVLKYGGENIDKGGWGGWISELGPISPKPQFSTEPHWLVVHVTGKCFWSGNSHCLLNFSKGYSSTGSGASLHYDKYGVYCWNCMVYEPWVLPKW